MVVLNGLAQASREGMRPPMRPLSPFFSYIETSAQHAERRVQVLVCIGISGEWRAGQNITANTYAIEITR